MIVVRGLRGSGKTTELAGISRATGYPILVSSFGIRDYIRQKYGVNVITVDELKKLRYDRVIVDEPEMIISCRNYAQMTSLRDEDSIFDSILKGVEIHAISVNSLGFDTFHKGVIKVVHNVDIPKELCCLGKLDELISHIKNNL